MNNVINIYNDEIKNHVSFDTTNTDEFKSIIYNEPTDINIVFEETSTVCCYKNVKSLILKEYLLEIIMNDDNVVRIYRTVNLEMTDYNNIILTTTKDYKLSVDIIGPDNNDCVSISMYYYPDNTYKKVLFYQYCSALSAASTIALFFEDATKLNYILSEYDTCEYIYINDSIYRVIEIEDYDIILEDIKGVTKNIPYHELSNSQCFMFSKDDTIIIKNMYMIRDGNIVGTVDELDGLIDYITDFEKSDLCKLINYRHILKNNTNQDIVSEEMNYLEDKYNDIFEYFKIFNNGGRLLYYNDKILYNLEK